MPRKRAIQVGDYVTVARPRHKYYDWKRGCETIIPPRVVSPEPLAVIHVYPANDWREEAYVVVATHKSYPSAWVTIVEGYVPPPAVTAPSAVTAPADALFDDVAFFGEEDS